MILFLRALLFYIVYVPLSIFYGSMSFLLLCLPKKTYVALLNLWSDATVIWLRLTCNISHTIEGEHNFKNVGGPCVIVSNHQSVWETYFLQGYLMPVCTVLKKELLGIPFFGWGLRLYDPIPIDRKNPVASIKKIKKDGVQRIQSGSSVLIFPEGTRRPPGDIGTYARSAVDIAKATGVPIIPIVHNAGCFWLNKRMIKIAGNIEMIIGEPIIVGDRGTKEVIAEIQEWTETRTAEIMARLEASKRSA